ncbi:MAG: Rab family GTPase [Candidatus Hodarchaeota archaeon]
MITQKKKNFAILVSVFDTHIGPRLFMSLPTDWHESSVDEKVASLLDTITLGFFNCVIASFKVISYHFEIPSEWARGKRELIMISVLFPKKYNITEDKVKKALKDTAEQIQNNLGLYKAFYIQDPTKSDVQVSKAKKELIQTISPLNHEIEALILESPKTIELQEMFINLKIVVVGEPAVGKTSLTSRYTTGEFRETYTVTIGMNFFRKNMQINEREVRIQFWDTGGQERYSPLLPVYYKGAHAATLIYDVTSRESFEKILLWLDRVHKYCPDAIICLVGNKKDLKSQRKVSNEEGVDLSKNLGCRYFETSAKTNDNVKEMFETIVSDLVSG